MRKPIKRRGKFDKVTPEKITEQLQGLSHKRSRLEELLQLVQAANPESPYPEIITGNLEIDAQLLPELVSLRVKHCAAECDRYIDFVLELIEGGTLKRSPELDAMIDRLVIKDDKSA
jgi:hypothetical protein